MENTYLFGVLTLIPVVPFPRLRRRRKPDRAPRRQHERLHREQGERSVGPAHSGEARVVEVRPEGGGCAGADVLPARGDDAVEDGKGKSIYVQLAQSYIWLSREVVAYSGRWQDGGWRARRA